MCGNDPVILLKKTENHIPVTKPIAESHADPLLCIEIYWGLDQVGSDSRVRPAMECHGIKSLEEAVAKPVPGQNTHLNK